MYKFYHILIYSRALNIYLLLEPIIQNWTVKNGVNGFKTKKILILEKKESENLHSLYSFINFASDLSISS